LANFFSISPNQTKFSAEQDNTLAAFVFVPSFWAKNIAAVEFRMISAETLAGS
jgi:hypothetical protein